MNNFKKTSENNDFFELQRSNNEILDNSKKTLLNTRDFSEVYYLPLRFYENSFEKEFLLQFIDYMNQPDFYKKYEALVNNLSIYDIRKINKILSRIRVIEAKPHLKRYNFYSLEEQIEKIKIKTDFTDKVLRINDNLFVYEKYKLPINHFERCVFLYKHGIELVKDLSKLKNKDFIDAGAFIGDSALVLSEYTDKNIYSFEANPINFDLLNKTIELNKLKNIVPIYKALYCDETEIIFNLNSAASSIEKTPGIKYNNVVKVQTITLDKFVQENNLNVGLIKVDLEGAELDFLKGAEKTIKGQKPVLLLSIYHKPTDFFELKPLLEQWCPDYEFTVFNPVDISILLETMIIAQPQKD